MTTFELSPKMILRAACSFAILISMITCSKDNEPSAEEIKERLLAGTGSKTWLIVSSTINGTEWLPECIKDDHWTFHRNKSVSRGNITTLCTNGLENTQSSTWSFGNNATWLTFFGGTYEIMSLTEETMKLRFPKGGTVYVDTFVKK